jgi:hypothetical protein
VNQIPKNCWFQKNYPGKEKPKKLIIIIIIKNRRLFYFLHKHLKLMVTNQFFDLIQKAQLKRLRTTFITVGVIIVEVITLVFDLAIF